MKFVAAIAFAGALTTAPAIAETYDWTATFRGETTIFGGAVTVDDSVIATGSLLLGKRCATANNCQSVGDWDHVSFVLPPILADALSGRGDNTNDLITASFDGAGNVTAASVSLSADEGFPGIVGLHVTGFGPTLTGDMTQADGGSQPYSLSWVPADPPGQPARVPEPGSWVLLLGAVGLFSLTRVTRRAATITT